MAQEQEYAVKGKGKGELDQLKSFYRSQLRCVTTALRLPKNRLDHSVELSLRDQSDWLQYMDLKSYFILTVPCLMYFLSKKF